MKMKKKEGIDFLHKLLDKSNNNISINGLDNLFMLIKEKLKDGNKYRILCIEGGGIRTLIQILFLCEIENYIKKPISQAFDCIVTSKDGIILCGLLTAQNEKGEIKYHANDILKIFNNQKETIYNPKLGKALKLELFKKLFDISEVIGNLFYFDEKTEGMLKIGSNDLISDLFANFIDNYRNKDQISVDAKTDTNAINVNNLKKKYVFNDEEEIIEYIKKKYNKRNVEEIINRGNTNNNNNNEIYEPKKDNKYRGLMTTEEGKKIKKNI